MPGSVRAQLAVAVRLSTAFVFTRHSGFVVTHAASAGIARLQELSSSEMQVLAQRVGVEAAGRTGRLLGSELAARLRASLAVGDRDDFDCTLNTTTPAHLCFEAIARVRLGLEAVFLTRRASVDWLLMSASVLIEGSHAAVKDLLSKDASTRLLLGEQRKRLDAIATLLAAAHGELWMSSGTQDGARTHLGAAFKETVSLMQTGALPPPALDTMSAVLENISHAGRLLEVDFTI